MFLAASNPPRQLLVTRYIGVVRRGELAQRLAETRALVAGLRPGFTVLVDLSQLEALDADCDSEIAAFMDCFTRAGVGRVVRVIPDPSKDIGFKILGIFHYPPALPVVECENFGQAARWLEAATGEIDTAAPRI